MSSPKSEMSDSDVDTDDEFIATDEDSPPTPPRKIVKKQTKTKSSSFGGNSKKVSGHLPVVAKQIILNVFNFIKANDGERGAVRKTSNMTLVNYQTVWKILNEDLHERKKRRDSGIPRAIKDDQADLIRQLIYETYKKTSIVTIEMLRKEVKETLNIDCGMETLRRFMIKIGFKYKKINKRRVFTESAKNCEKKSNSLQKIAE